MPCNLDEFKKMVRNRPVPDTPGYYHLDVYAFNSRNKYQENVENRFIPDTNPIKFERYIDQGNVNFRIPVNCDNHGIDPLGADYATCAEAIVDMCKLIGKAGILGFVISRYGFGQLAHNRFPIEEWMYDAKGEFVQHSSCSCFHYMKPGMYGKFFGHETLPYKEGDKVMILHRYVGDTQIYAVPGIIIYETDDLRKGYEDYTAHIEDWVSKGNSPATWADETCYPGSDEDEYFVQYGSYDPSEIHFTFQPPTRIFPLPFPLPKEIDDEMNEWYHEYKVKSQEL